MSLSSSGLTSSSQSFSPDEESAKNKASRSFFGAWLVLDASEVIQESLGSVKLLCEQQEEQYCRLSVYILSSHFSLVAVIGNNQKIHRR